MSAFEDVVEAWGFRIAGDKPVALSPAGIAPDGTIVYSDAESFRDLIGAEPELGSPSVNGWILSSSSAGVRSWVAPNAHTHAIADVTGLQAALDAKMATASYPDLVAIEALAGTSGLLRKTAANTWALDTASYLTTAGTAAAATKLATGRTIGITGDATWTSPSFDGTANVAASLTLASVITAGGPVGGASTVPVITYDAKGRLTAVTTATITPAGIGAATAAHDHTSILPRGAAPSADVPPSGFDTTYGLSFSTVYYQDYPSLYGNILNIRGRGGNQIFAAWSGVTGNAAGLWFRNKRDYGDVWGPFQRVIDSVTDAASITNWSTAYSWGNHASAGYAAASHTHAISAITGLQGALDAKQNSLGYTPINKAGDSGIGSLFLSYGQRLLVGKDVQPVTVNNTNYASAPLVVEREATSGSVYSAGIGFHNRGLNASFLYYDSAYEVFRYNRHYGAICTIWDSQNLTDISQLANGPGYAVGSQVNYGSTFDGSPDPFTNRNSCPTQGGVRTWYGAGPFGTWYHNVVDIRHRNGQEDGATAYGGQLVWGFPGTPRLAFRATGDSWTEVWTSANLPASTLGKSLLNSADQAAARATLGAQGLTLLSQGSDQYVAYGTGEVTRTLSTVVIPAASFNNFPQFRRVIESDFRIVSNSSAQITLRFALDGVVFKSFVFPFSGLGQSGFVRLNLHAQPNGVGMAEVFCTESTPPLKLDFVTGVLPNYNWAIERTLTVTAVATSDFNIYSSHTVKWY
jgi:hypothetical protein